MYEPGNRDWRGGFGASDPSFDRRLVHEEDALREENRKLKELFRDFLSDLAGINLPASIRRKIREVKASIKE